ncbi:GNAT family N-acetyltransferase [Paractinoplanes lichenicola]|uniref:GNAT family N-acetyltransferase n=1 Tax=Paractinoplanes lichenicola TaxID=2802976 RepID=A0ABS1VXK6_9ACTN|nr:GNAT family N-acetyltransferase [Actinoplanes lichenicola]
MGEPVVLRRLTARDAPVIAAWATDPEFVREAGWPPTRSADEYLRHHADLIKEPPPGFLRLGVRAGDDLVGYVDFYGEDPERREIGFLIGLRNLWGRGLGRAAVAAGLRYGFGELGLREITAEAYAAHRRSIHILHRLGFHETGRRDDHGAPSLCFSITAPRLPRGIVAG